MRNPRFMGLIVILALAAMHVGPASAQQTPPNMQELMKAMGQMMSPGTNASALVDFRELKALLPASLEGMKRTNASGEKSGALGMAVAFAEGTYEADSGGRVEIKITDLAGTGSALGLARGWTITEIDRESDTGYERTTTIGGHKAYEKYDGEQKRGEVQVMVKEHFMVEISGSDVSMETMKEALGKIDLDQLAELKPAVAK
ncbi:MAG: hypothetical protein V1929_01900 [bacterium]